VRDLSGESSRCTPDALPQGSAIYGFSTYSVTYAATLALAQAVRERNPQALLVAGGPHATALPHRVQADGFDVVVTGEGEMAMCTIARAHRQGIAIPARVKGESPANLDDLPLPAYDLIDYAGYHRVVDGERCASVLTSRGCPFQCSFCNSNVMGAGRPLRLRSPDNVIAEVRWLRRTLGVRHLRFQDDSFTLHRRRLRALTRLLAAEGVVYRCFSRVTGFNREVAQWLAQSGCCHVSFGVESGSPSILGRHAMNKGQTPEAIRSALHYARAAGLEARIYLIVGFPGETDDTIAETYDLIRDCPWNEFMVYPLIAYPGTPIHDRPDAFGVLEIDSDYDHYLQAGRGRSAGYTIRTRDFGPEQVRAWREGLIARLVADGRTWAGESSRYR
jgi:radical SAM superfamily enzyme YgiQ (UPF0313 family)